MIAARTTPRLYAALKRTLDIVVAGAVLVLSAPLMVAAMIAIATIMGSPVLFRQFRPGRNGRSFELFKFRTMLVQDPQHEDDAEAARLTPIGRMLRTTSIDELPTLINVLKGDMSLVGPRPLLMRYLTRYSTEQARRHEVKPGITGWAQVNGRNLLTWSEKLSLDVWYVDHASFSLDLAILARTIWKVLRREGINHAGAATMIEFLGSQNVNQNQESLKD